MKQQVVTLLLYNLLLALCLSITSCGDGCNDDGSSYSSKMESAGYYIYFLENDTLNTITSVYYPQVDKTLPLNTWSSKTVKYLYGFDENTIVLNYKYPDLRPSDTIVITAKIKGLEEVPCRSEYMVQYEKIEVKQHPFKEIRTSNDAITVIKR